MHRGMTPSPDSGFVKDLKTFDPKLEIAFDRRYDAFVITQPSQVSHAGSTSLSGARHIITSE